MVFKSLLNHLSLCPLTFTISNLILLEEFLISEVYPYLRQVNIASWHLCMCKKLWSRMCAVNGVQQTWMKRQETKSCWQALSEPTAGIRFYLETDVMVIDPGVQPPARHSSYRSFGDIFHSNQRAVKPLLCECSELQGPQTGLLSLVKLRVE